MARVMGCPGAKVEAPVPCSSPWLETNATAPAAQWVAGTSVKVPPAAGRKVSVRLPAS